jgi:GNAT superfamily N-acetyltransferase
MGVKPSYRHNGVGSQLLSAVETILIQNGNKDVQFPIVESFCYPSCTFDLSQWLTHRKYAATRVMKGTGVYMGEKEDEIVFTKSLRV